MATTPSRQSDYISEARENARKLWAAVNDLQAMQEEWNAQTYGSTLANGSGSNEGILATDVGACVFATADALRIVLDDGHATNITNLL